MTIFVYTKIPSSGNWACLSKFATKQNFEVAKKYYDIIQINQLLWKIRATSDTIPWIKSSHRLKKEDSNSDIVIEVEKFSQEKIDSEWGILPKIVNPLTHKYPFFSDFNIEFVQMVKDI